MRGQRGASLFELLVAMSVAILLLGLAAAYSVPALARGQMRSAIRDVQGLLQLARVEAVKRNRPCRFALDAASGRLQVWDGNDTAASVDDRLLVERRVPSSVTFAGPTAGSPVSLEPIGGSMYQTVFGPQGSVASGTGSVQLYGGDEYVRLSVYGAGGLTLERWDDGQWHAL